MNVTVTIPDQVVTDLAPNVGTFLLSKGYTQSAIDALTGMQKARAYLAEIVKDVYISDRRNAATVAGQAAINAAVATATTVAAGIV